MKYYLRKAGQKPLLYKDYSLSVQFSRFGTVMPITAVLEKTDGNVRKAQKLSRHAKLNTLQIYDDNRNRDQLEMSELLMDGLD
jgi:hypothetical protein